VGFRPHPDCQVCQSLEEKEIFVRKDAYAFMKRESANAKGIETGGILIGYQTPRGRFVVRKATGPGPKAVRTRARFQRDVEFCQIEIDRAAAEYGPQGQYLGEWHYHAVDDNSPSGVDIKSLTEIAEQDNYLIEHHVMVIFSASLECAITIHDKTGRCVRLPLNIFEGEPPV
jgi:integrative and conjugative element protein (TIGR02256 family)